MKIIVAEFKNSSRIICLEGKNVKEVASKVKALRNSHNIIGVFDLLKDLTDLEEKVEEVEE